MAENLIREATPDDAEAVYTVQHATWLATYPSEEHGVTVDDVRALIERGGVEARIAQWGRRLANDAQPQAWVAVDENDRVVGFVAPFVDRQRDDELRLGAIYVLPEAQGRGVGHALVERVLAEVGVERDIHLHVAAYNDRAIAFYERHGFRRSGLDTTQHGEGPVIPEFEMIRRSQVRSG